jgi:hypothetical protein
MAYPTENLRSTCSEPHGPDSRLDEVPKRLCSVLIVDSGRNVMNSLAAGPDDLTPAASA